MGFSKVYTSMRDENNLDCSFAVIVKENSNGSDNDSVLVIVKDKDIAVLDYNLYIRNNKLPPRYLLIKQHTDNKVCYKDFLKLIGKMCKNTMESKYFRNRRDEDNRMLLDLKSGNFVLSERYMPEPNIYDARLKDFKEYINTCCRNNNFQI